MALTQVSTEGIKNGTITGSDLATNVDLVDDQKLRFGTGNDLEIYGIASDGTAAIINHANGDLLIKHGSDNLVDTDLSAEPAEVSAICNAVWTTDVKAAWKAKLIADKTFE